MKIPLIGPSSEARSLTADAQRTVNYYVESGGPAAKSPAGFYGRPGLRSRVTLGGRATALAAINGRLFVMSANTLKELSSVYATVQSIAGIVTSTPGLKDWILLNGLTPNFLQVFMLGANGAAYWWQEGAVAAAIYLDELAGFASTNGKEVDLAPGVDTVVGVGIAAGVHAVTPDSMDLITAGIALWIDEGEDNAELVIVSSVTGTTFTATFFNDHADGFLVQAGDRFDVASAPGSTIVIGGVAYTVDYAQNAFTLQLTTSAGVQAQVDWRISNVLLKGSSATFLGGYGVITRPGTRQFNISKFNDFSVWRPLDYELKEGYADNLVRAIAHSQELWLFGNETTEAWDQTGDPDFPFKRNPSGAIKRGLGAIESLVELADSLYLIGNDGVAYRTRGFALERISTHAQELDWKSEFSTVRAFGFEMLGHYFWQINGSVKSWIYDVGENVWTEWGLLNTGTGNTFYRAIPDFHAYVQEWSGGRVGADEGSTSGTHVVSGYNDSKLYEMSTDFHDDDGTAIRYVRRWAHICIEKLKLFWHSLTLEVETGQVAIGDTVPLMELRISADGGKTWRQASGGGDLVVTQSMGAHGVTTQRLIYRQLGSGRDLVPEIACTSKSKMVVLDAYGEITKGNS